MTELTTERRTYVWTRENGDFGIAYKLRSSWRRNFHSTQMLKVMIETRGREVGRQCARKRASTCLGRGGEKRTERYLARRLLYSFGSLKEECVGNRVYPSHEQARQARFEKGGQLSS